MLKNEIDPSLLAIEMQRICNKSLPEIATELFFLNQKVENLENTISKIYQIKGIKENDG